MKILRTIVGATIGGIMGGPLGALAGAAIANDPTVGSGETSHDE